MIFQSAVVADTGRWLCKSHYGAAVTAELAKTETTSGSGEEKTELDVANGRKILAVFPGCCKEKRILL